MNLYAPGVTREEAIRQVGKIARQVAYDRGPAMIYAQVAERCDARWPARLIGFAVWTSAPDEALKPY